MQKKGHMFVLALFRGLLGEGARAGATRNSQSKQSWYYGVGCSEMVLQKGIQGL